MAPWYSGMVSVLLAGGLLLSPGVGGAPAAAQEQGFLPPCVASPVEVREAPGTGQAKKGLALYLSTRCTRTGDSFFWDCQEKQEAGKLLMDCIMQRAEGGPGPEVRVVFTTRERLGAVLCGVACQADP